MIFGFISSWRQILRMKEPINGRRVAMSGLPAEIIGDRAGEQPCDGWNPSYHPEFREFLDHVAEILAQEYVRKMRETANPEDLEAWEKGGRG